MAGFDGGGGPLNRDEALPGLRKDQPGQFAEAQWRRSLSSVVALAGMMPEG